MGIGKATKSDIIENIGIWLCLIGMAEIIWVVL